MEQPVPDFFAGVEEHNQISSQVHTMTTNTKYSVKIFPVNVSGRQMAQKIPPKTQNLTYN